MYVKNNSSDKLFENTMRFDGLEGLKLRKPNRGTSLKMILPPGEEFIALFTVGTKGYTFKLSESYTV